MSNPVPDMKLQVVMLPVSDIDRTLAFYTDKVGFNVDHDVNINENMRVVQLTPPGSDCSIVFGKGMGEIGSITPGSVKGLHLVVKDIAKSREVLANRGLEVSEIMDMGGILYVNFSDPDNNTWLLQEITPNAKRPDTI